MLLYMGSPIKCSLHFTGVFRLPYPMGSPVSRMLHLAQARHPRLLPLAVRWSITASSNTEMTTKASTMGYMCTRARRSLAARNETKAGLPEGIFKRAGMFDAIDAATTYTDALMD